MRPQRWYFWDFSRAINISCPNITVVPKGIEGDIDMIYVDLKDTLEPVSVLRNFNSSNLIIRNATIFKVPDIFGLENMTEF